MRVLLMGGPGPNFEDTRRELEEAHHEVTTCHDRDEPVFPCKAFTGRCPLDEGHMDAAVVVRNHAWPRPTPFDRGATCAVRQKVPVVMTGVGVLNPYEEWTDITVTRSDDLVAAVERLIDAPRVEHSNVATEAVRKSLKTTGIDPGDARATVHRRHGWLRVELEALPEISRLNQQNVARRVISALRELDRHAFGVDVNFTDDRSEEGARWAGDR